jgi:hypothetical protein
VSSLPWAKSHLGYAPVAVRRTDPAAEAAERREHEGPCRADDRECAETARSEADSTKTHLRVVCERPAKHAEQPSQNRTPLERTKTSATRGRRGEVRPERDEPRRRDGSARNGHDARAEKCAVHEESENGGEGQDQDLCRPRRPRPRPNVNRETGEDNARPKP